MNFIKPHYECPPSNAWMARFVKWRSEQPEFAAFMEQAKVPGTNWTELYEAAGRAGISKNEANSITGLSRTVTEDVQTLIERHEKLKAEHEDAKQYADELIKRSNSEVLSHDDRAKLDNEIRQAFAERDRLLIESGAARVARRKAEALQKMVAA